MDVAANLILLGFAALLLFSLVSRSRRAQRTFSQTQAALAPGREVVTAAGLYARVVAVEDDVVVLETAPGQRSRWARQAIARVLPDDALPPADPATTDPSALPPSDPAPPPAGPAGTDPDGRG